MKKLSLILLLFWCLSLTACSKDSQANAFLKEYAAVSSQVAEKLEDGDVGDARKVYESKKASLNAKWKPVRSAMSFQISAETKKRIDTEPEKNMTKLADAAKKAIEKKPDERKKVEALVMEFSDIFKR